MRVGVCMSEKHGHTVDGKKTGEYRAWVNMRDRCKADSGPDAERYLARGIKVCRAWETSFLRFLEDMGPKPSWQHSLDRIDNDKGYGPSNCRWATKLQQSRNMCRNVFVEFNGRSICQTEFAEIFGVSDATIIAKFKKGMTVYQIAVFYEKKHKKNYINRVSSLRGALESLGRAFNGEKHSFFSIGKYLG